MPNIINIMRERLWQNPNWRRIALPVLAGLLVGTALMDAPRLFNPARLPNVAGAFVHDLLLTAGGYFIALVIISLFFLRKG